MHEAAAQGVHRLGHAIALGIDPGVFDITLADELDWVCTHTGGGDGLRRELIEAAWSSRSERLGGRERREADLAGRPPG